MKKLWFKRTNVIGKCVKKLAVGSAHVLALTEDGEVYGWGRNDNGELGKSKCPGVVEPTLIESLKGKSIAGLACGPNQVRLRCFSLINLALTSFAFQTFVWASSNTVSVGLRVAFVVDVCEETFRSLSQLLAIVSDGVCRAYDWPPPQDKECMTVACLNLLRLQVGNYV